MEKEGNKEIRDELNRWKRKGRKGREKGKGKREKGKGFTWTKGGLLEVGKNE